MDRSPLSPHALTLDELRALPPGTEIIFYNMRLGAMGGTRVIESVDDTTIHTKGTDDKHDFPVYRNNFFWDAGLVPNTAVGWNATNVTILAERLPQMPIIGNAVEAGGYTRHA